MARRPADVVLNLEVNNNACVDVTNGTSPKKTSNGYSWWMRIVSRRQEYPFGTKRFQNYFDQ